MFFSRFFFLGGGRCPLLPLSYTLMPRITHHAGYSFITLRQNAMAESRYYDTDIKRTITGLCPLGCISVVCPSVCPSVNFCANRFFSQTNGRIATKLAHDGRRVSVHPGCAQCQGQGQRSRDTRTFLDSWIGMSYSVIDGLVLSYVMRSRRIRDDRRTLRFQSGGIARTGPALSVSGAVSSRWQGVVAIRRRRRRRRCRGPAPYVALHKGAITSKTKHAINLKRRLKDLHNCYSLH